MQCGLPQPEQQGTIAAGAGVVKLRAVNGGRNGRLSCFLFSRFAHPSPGVKTNINRTPQRKTLSRIE